MDLDFKFEFGDFFVKGDKHDLTNRLSKGYSDYGIGLVIVLNNTLKIYYVKWANM